MAGALRLTGHDWQRFVECHLQAWRLGQQQRSEFWTGIGAASALTTAAYQPLEVGQRAFAAALAAFEETAEAAVRRCKRLLPEEWALSLQHNVDVAASLLPRAHEQLRLLQQARGGSLASRAAVRASAIAQWAAAEKHIDTQIGGSHRLEPEHANSYDGCGQQAVGLRRCSRCKRAQYCR